MKIEVWQAFAGVVAAMFGGGGVGIAALMRVAARNGLDRSNSAVALATAYGKLIDQLEGRIGALESENGQLRDRVASLEGQITTLTAVTKAGPG